MMAALPPSFTPRLLKRVCHFERSEKSHVICSELVFLFERLSGSVHWSAPKELYLNNRG
jgi:hypothetical protein